MYIGALKLDLKHFRLLFVLHLEFVEILPRMTQVLHIVLTECRFL